MKTRAPIILAALVLAAALAKGQLTHNPVVVPTVGIGTGLDPLTPAERILAVQIAQADPSVNEALSGFRHVTIGASLSLPEAKPVELPIQVLRAAEVQFYRYEAHDTLIAHVDLQNLRVLGLTLDVREPVLVVEELQVAKPMLLEDPRVFDALGGALADVELINAGAVQVDPGMSPCEFNRCFETRFVRYSGANMVDLEPVPDLFARFDLTEMRVDDVWFG